MGGKRILKRENISLPNSNVRHVIPQVFHKQSEHGLEFTHIHCASVPAKKLVQATISNVLFIYPMS